MQDDPLDHLVDNQIDGWRWWVPVIGWAVAAAAIAITVALLDDRSVVTALFLGLVSGLGAAAMSWRLLTIGERPTGSKRRRVDL